MNEICSHDIFTRLIGLIMFVLRAFVPMVIVIIALSQIHSTVNKLFKCTKDINNCSRQKASVVEKRYKRRKIECRQREIREKERRKDKYR